MARLAICGRIFYASTNTSSVPTEPLG